MSQSPLHLVIERWLDSAVTITTSLRLVRERADLSCIVDKWTHNQMGARWFLYIIYHGNYVSMIPNLHKVKCWLSGDDMWAKGGKTWGRWNHQELHDPLLLGSIHRNYLLPSLFHCHNSFIPLPQQTQYILLPQHYIFVIMPLLCHFAQLHSCMSTVPTISSSSSPPHISKRVEVSMPNSSLYYSVGKS